MNALRKAKRRTTHLVLFICTCLLIMISGYLVDAYYRTENVKSVRLEKQATINEFESSKALFEEVRTLRLAISFSEKFLEDAKMYKQLLKTTCEFKGAFKLSEQEVRAYKDLFDGCSSPNKVSKSQLPQLQELLRTKTSTPSFARAEQIDKRLNKINEYLRYKPDNYYPKGEAVLTFMSLMLIPLGFLFVYIKFGTNVILKNSFEFVQIANRQDRETNTNTSVNIVNTDKFKQYSVAEELLKWKELKDSGVINEQEFIQAKAKILNS